MNDETYESVAAIFGTDIKGIDNALCRAKEKLRLRLAKSRKTSFFKQVPAVPSTDDKAPCSGVPCITWIKERKMWLVRFRYKGKKRHVGEFTTLVGAKKALKRAKKDPEKLLFDLEHKKKRAGISFSIKYGKWKAEFQHDGKIHYIGMFSTEQEALERCTAALNDPTGTIAAIFARREERKRKSGVNYDPRYDRWVARIARKGKNLHVGSYHTEEEARAARQKQILLLEQKEEG